MSNIWRWKSSFGGFMDEKMSFALRLSKVDRLYYSTSVGVLKHPIQQWSQRLLGACFISSEEYHVFSPIVYS